MRDGWLWGVVTLLVAAGALAIRVVGLDDAPRGSDGRPVGVRGRPMHADEAVQAARFRRLWEEGRYVYNPEEFHGPTLAYATLPAMWASGHRRFAETTAGMYRLVPACFGAALVLLLLLLRDALGRPAALAAGVFTAVSPAMVFYSRYYIHETLLVFFTLAAMACGWRYARTGRPGWCLASGGCLGLIQATKETSVLIFFSMGVALGFAWLWPGRRGLRGGDGPRTVRPWHLALGLGVAVLVAVTLLSSFFTHLPGPLDGVLAYGPWVGRAGGESIHDHPWYHYLRLLGWWQRDGGPVWSEGAILGLAAVGLAASLLPERFRLLGRAHPFFARWLAGYTVVLTAVYSAIPYKTPWCLLGFLNGMILLAGLGAAALVRAVPGRVLKAVTVLAVAAASSHLAWQAYRANFVMAADRENPYVYAQTLPDIRRLARDVTQLAAAARQGTRLGIDVIWHDPYYWPIPWYLRRFERVRYWRDVPAELQRVVIASPWFDARLRERLEATHQMPTFYGIRPNLFAEIWVEKDLWESHLRRLGRLPPAADRSAVNP